MKTCDGELTPKSELGIVARVLAILAAIALLGLVSLASFGTVLLAPLGMLVYAKVQRRRGQPSWSAATWFVAGGSVALGLLIVAGGVASNISSDDLRTVRRAMDSASTSAPQRPSPAWLERMQRTAGGGAIAPVKPVKYGTGMMVFGGIFLVNILSALVGTLGWLGGILLWCGITGRVPWRSPPPAPDMVAEN